MGIDVNKALKLGVGTVALGLLLTAGEATAAWNASCTDGAFSISVTSGTLRAKCKSDSNDSNVTDSLDCCNGLQVASEIAPVQPANIVDDDGWLVKRCANNRVSAFASSQASTGIVIGYIGCVDPKDDDDSDEVSAQSDWTRPTPTPEGGPPPRTPTGPR